MKLIRATFLAAAAHPRGLRRQQDRQDRGPAAFDSKHLSQLQAGIWVDPNGCDHWIIDDGIEGYLSQRLDQYGKPVCSGVAPPNTAVGPFKSGSHRRSDLTGRPGVHGRITATGRGRVLAALFACRTDDIFARRLRRPRAWHH
jgi:hypothetical protein